MDQPTDTLIEPPVVVTDEPDRPMLWLALILGVALMILLYLLAWLATRYEGADRDDTLAPATTTAAPTTTATPPTTATTEAPATSEAPATTATTTTAAPVTTDGGDTAEPVETIAGLVGPSSGFGTLGGALEAAGLLDTLSGSGPYTLLAPTLEAFNRLGTPTLERLIDDTDGLLTPTLLHHVIEGDFEGAALTESGTTLTSLAGERLDFSTDGTDLFVNDSIRITGAELPATNGRILVIEGVLIPQRVSTALTAGEIADIVALDPIRFDDGSATIRPESIPTLEGTVELLTGDPGARVEIGGHTDDVGPADGNLRLSVRRAEAVRDYLIGAGIDPDRLEAVGYGQELPIADNTTEEGRAANRRIEFTPLLDQ